jgi:hypothetical protein
MKYSTIVSFLFFVFLLPSLKAQQNHFIYIQHETNQSFYVKLDNKTYNSSAAGYVILPKLKDGTYKLSIGFPSNSIIEQNMVCTVDKADIGFILKNFENKGWGLFNLQTLNVLMDNGAVNSNNISVVNKTDAFSNMLSEVVNDSTIRQADPMINENNKVTIKEQEKKSTDLIVEQEPVIQKSKVEMSNNTSAAIVKTRDSLQGINVKQVVSNNGKSSISRSLIKKEAQGIRMVFVDRIKGTVDTVNVFISEDKLPVEMIDVKPIETKVPVQQINPAVSIKEDKVGKARFIDIELPVSSGVNSDKKPVENAISESKESSSMNIERVAVDLPAQQAHQTLMVNSDCTVLASEEDIMKLRKRIMAAGSDDDKLKVTKKYLKAKCFMVEQIRELSVLFSKDDARISYFEIAFPFVFDSNNFVKLQNQLKDPNYINRFQLMIRH